MSNSQIKIEELRHVRAFANFSALQLKTLALHMVKRTYAPGQYIFFEGDEATSLWFIVTGKVKIIKQSMNGRMQGLCLANRGKCFGSCPLFDAETNPADAQALNDVVLAVIPRESAQRLIENDPKIAHMLLQVYNDRLRLLASLSERLGTWSVGRRINESLLSHAKQTSDGLFVELTHEELATFVGTAREVVSRYLAELEAGNIIRSDVGRIEVLNVAALDNMCIASDTSVES